MLNKEARAIRRKLWKTENKDKVKAQKARYKAKHKERELEKRRVYEKGRRDRLRQGIDAQPSPERDIDALQRDLSVIYKLKEAAREQSSSKPGKSVRLKRHGHPTECEICGSSESLVWDHDHALEEVGLPSRVQFRGWLCNGCNSGIGFLQDSPEILLKAAAYLQMHEEKRARLLLKSDPNRNVLA